MEKVFLTTQRVLVCLEVVGKSDDDGNVTITDVRRLIDLPSPQELMESMSQDDFEQLDRDFADAP